MPDDILYGDLPPDEFRRAAQRVVAWITAYLEDPERYPVLARVGPGALRETLPDEPPATGESLDAILDDFESRVLPGITHWNHPRFFAYFGISASVPGILGEMLAAALNVNAMLWRTSPSATELEQVATAWLRRLMGLRGDDWFGMITDTASMSTLIALAAAREAREELRVRELGLSGRADLPPLRVYCSSHAHSSVEKAAITLGIGHANVVLLPVDDAFRLRPDALAAAIAEDRAAGRLPIAVVATVGTTSTTSVDPVPELARICAAEQLWLHVDAAYGGALAVVPELRHVLSGVERADSLVVNPHKWLFTPIDCSVLYTRRPDVLRRAFSLVPEYLTTPDEDVLNLMDYGPQLGRRFRALKLWMVLRAFGAEGMAARIRGHVALARRLAAWVDADPEWERMAPVPASTVCLRWVGDGTLPDDVLNARNAAILAAVNASGRAFLSHTVLDGRYAIRVAIGNIRTREEHVRDAWEELKRQASAVDSHRSAAVSTEH